uniref:Leucine-rich repeat-containing N-terminal plant-type domain-containing protein n=1 Tax=Aegilops tauschii TaxID=37682 RepID=R7WDT8_AEGTA
MAEDTKFLLLFLLLSSSSLCFGSEQDIQCMRSVQQSVIDPLGVLKSSWNFGYATDGYICYFAGEIPESIANLAYLNVLKLQHNELSGQIPEWFSMLNRLTTFIVADNFLSGPIPTFAHYFSPLYFAGNRELCGAPLDECPRSRRWRLIPIRLHKINEESSIGVAVGFVLGFVVAFYFHLLCCERLLPCVFRT